MSSQSRTNQQQQTTQNQSQTQSSSGSSGFSGANTFDFLTPPDTEDIRRQRGFQFQHDPRVGNAFSRQRRMLHESYGNPFGANTTQSLRDAALRAGDEDSAQNEAQAYREESHGLQGLQYGQLSDVANLTRPQLVQTGQSGTSHEDSHATGTSSGTASGTGTTTQSQPLLPGLIQGASGVGSALIM